MLQSAWLFIGVAAIIWTGIAVYTSDDAAAILFGILGFVTWGAWTYGSLKITVVGDSVTYQFTMPAVTFVGICFALVPAFIALTGPINIIGRHDNPNPREI